MKNESVVRLGMAPKLSLRSWQIMPPRPLMHLWSVHVDCGLCGIDFDCACSRGACAAMYMQRNLNMRYLIDKESYDRGGGG